MVSISPTKDRSPRLKGAAGFTLVEIMMVTLISSFVFAGVLSAYMFLGRGLARQINEQGLESRSRQALFWFTQDISTSSSVMAQNPGAGVTGTLMTLFVPGLGTNVYYACDWTLPASGILTRRVGPTGPVVKLLTNLKTFSIGYYDPAGNAITAPASATAVQTDIKQAYMVYTSSAGVASTGASSNLTVVSPRVTFKNKSVLTDPTTP